jgi:hypothetical protein
MLAVSIERTAVVRSAPGTACNRPIRREAMARKPNYRFERKERERIKAEKKAERAAAKEEARKQQSDSPDDAGEFDDRQDAGRTDD